MLSLARMLAVEVVLVAVLFAVSRQLWLTILVAVVAVLVTVGLFGRSDGRWWTESAMLWLRFRRRSGTVGESREDPRLAALCELAPDLQVEDIPGANDARIGMGADGAGWFAVLEVSSSANSPLPPVPLAALARIAADAEQAGVVMQVVSHNAGAANQRERTVWVAVRLDAATVAESVLHDAKHQVDIPAVLAEVVRRAERVLRRRGVTARALTADELVGALAASCDLVPNGTPVQAREHWDSWQSARLTHGCFWLASWPNSERGIALLAALAELPAPVVSIAIVLEPGYQGTLLSCLVRIAAPPQAFRQVCDRAVQLARRAGGHLSRLDGQHAAAVYASAPSGGGAR